MSDSARWGIVGGGILGLTIALRLAKNGEQVTVIEGADRLGGLASAWELGSITWDRHYHVTLLSDTNLRGLLSDLGLEQDMKWVETKTGCFANGRLYSVSDTIEFLRLPFLNVIDKLRLGGTIFYGSKIRDGRRLEGILVQDWLERWSGKRTFRRFWLPLLRSKLGENYAHTSAAFIWSTIARLYAARRSGLKREMFGYLPGGYERILNRFETVLRELDVRFQIGTPVSRVSSTDLGPMVQLEGHEPQDFDRLVVTTPAPVANAICADLNDTERAALDRIQYQGIVCASCLLLKPLAGFYVTNIIDDWVPFTGVIEMSALVDRDQFGGLSLVYLPRYLASDDPFFNLSDSEIQDQFYSALRRMFPDLEESDLVSFQISRVRHVLPLSTLNYTEFLPPIQTSVEGLYLVNSSQIVNGTLNVNETVQLADRAVEELIH